MIEALCDFAWQWLPGLLLVLLAAVLWLTDYLAWHRGRIAGLAEADRRDRQRDHYCYQRGVFDTARTAGDILRKRGATADAAALPVALLRGQPSTPR